MTTQVRRRNSTLRRDPACLSSVFSCALDWEWVNTDPVPPFVKFHRRNKALRNAAKRTGIKNLIWHGLRRTCGNWKLQSGVPIKVVSQLLGHASIAVTERAYTFLKVEHLHKVLEHVPTISAPGHADSD